jgi:hypothetical protein
MVKGKLGKWAITPDRAKWLTTQDVVELFGDEKPALWSELWERAKKSDPKIPYPTLKRKVKWLVEHGFLKADVSVNEESFGEAIFKPLIPLAPIYYLMDIIQFLEKQLEMINERPIYFGKFHAMRIFSDLGQEKIKPFITERDERKLVDIGVVLFEIRDRIVLSSYNKTERSRLDQYLQMVSKVAEVFVEHYKEGIKKEFREVDAKLKEKHSDIDGMKVFDLVMKDLKKIDEGSIIGSIIGVFDSIEKLPQYLQLNESEKERVRPSIKWLMDNRYIYEEYEKRTLNAGKILLIMGVGFRGYMEKEKETIEKWSSIEGDRSLLQSVQKWKIEQLEKALMDDKQEEEKTITELEDIIKYQLSR